MLLFFTLEERDLLLAKVTRLEAENAALMADLREADYMGCKHCKHYPQKGKCRSDCVDCKQGCICNECYHNSLWQWRGINGEAEGAHPVHGGHS